VRVVAALASSILDTTKSQCVSSQTGFSQQMTCRRELRLSASNSVHAEGPHMQRAEGP